jgi:hypothetical protein
MLESPNTLADFSISRKRLYDLGLTLSGVQVQILR